MGKRSALGRGLGALIDDAEKITEAAPSINEIDISQIEANPFQPRSNFSQESLSELAASIREIGMIQPLTLRMTEENKYQIIAGERRYRAAQMAGLKRVDDRDGRQFHDLGANLGGGQRPPVPER